MKPIIDIRFFKVGDRNTMLEVLREGEETYENLKTVRHAPHPLPKPAPPKFGSRAWWGAWWRQS